LRNDHNNDEFDDHMVIVTNQFSQEYKQNV
jgi:hypothetical protein